MKINSWARTIRKVRSIRKTPEFPEGFVGTGFWGCRQVLTIRG